MLTLDATTASLEVVLAGAITTNQLPIVSSWADKTTTTFTPGKTTTQTNSTSTITIVAAPAASTQREVHSINVYNADTVAATITIRENDNSTLRTLVKVTLVVGDTLFYTHSSGWKVMDSTGAEKVNSSLTLTGDVTGTGSSSIATTVAKIQGTTVSGTTGTGNVAFSADPTFTGNPLAPTAAENDNDTSIATTAFVAANQSETWASINNTSKNNAGTPNTQFDLTADVVVLRNSSNHVVVRYAPGTVTNNVSTAGSAANGRDQAGAFSASSWIHFYWIWNGTTLATLSSTVAPTTGPTLPATYTHWAYCGAVRFDSGSALVKTRFRGSWAFYEGRINILSSGSATTETAVDISSVVPPNALECQTEIVGDNISDAVGTLTLTQLFRVISGSNFYALQTQLSGLGLSAATLTPGAVVRFPNVAQNFYYLNTNTAGTGRLTVTFHGYANPNGGRS